MKLSTRHVQLALATCLIATGLWAAGSEATRPRVMAVGANMERHDLSELADGETREFGGGEHRVTAQRVGDIVTVNMAKGKGDGESSFTCDVKAQSCIVMTGDEGGHHKMVVIKKSGDGSETEKEEERVAVFVGSGSEDTNMTWVDAEGEGNSFAMATGSGPMVVEMGMGDKVMLRCPEGDTSMTLDKSEAEVAYRCPKHNLALTKVDSPMRHVIRREIRLNKDDDKAKNP